MFLNQQSTEGICLKGGSLSKSNDILRIIPNFDYYAINLSDEFELDHLHIKKVEVFTGPDNGEETELISITTIDNYFDPKLKALVKKNHHKKANGRLRGEPCVRLYIDNEENHSTYVLEIFHHKGTVIIKNTPIGNICEKDCCNDQL